jgi:hypothetical protein
MIYTHVLNRGGRGVTEPSRSGVMGRAHAVFWRYAGRPFARWISARESDNRRAKRHLRAMAGSSGLRGTLREDDPRRTI